MAPTFPGADGGCEDGVASAVAAGRRRDARGKEKGQDVVLLLFVRTKQPVFHEESSVTPAVESERGAMNEIGGHAQNYFDAPGRDQLQAFACPVNIGARATTLLFMRKIVPKFFFEARRHCQQRRDPM